MSNQLIRYESDKVVTGVCGGIANYFGINPVLVRIGTVAGTIALGVWPGVLAYGVMTLVMPKEGMIGRVEDDDVIIGEYEKHP